MRRLGQLLRDLAVHARNADFQTRLEEEGVAGAVQIDLRIDRRRACKLDPTLGGGVLDRGRLQRLEFGAIPARMFEPGAAP